MSKYTLIYVKSSECDVNKSLTKYMNPGYPGLTPII